jgi:pSer/pThr/pTyr-binding forkhead associated (FHA) protein
MSKLVCLTGMNKGDEFPLHEGKNIVGRGQDCNIVLFDKKCSRHHFQIIKKGKHYAIEDLDSSNGTVLNGKIVGKATSFDPGDKIVIGGSKLMVSEKGVGGFLDQTATDVAAELQSGEYKKLLDSTARTMVHNHPRKSKNSVSSFFHSIFKKK